MESTGTAESGQEGALQWILEQAQKSQPFFLVISLINPHDVLFYPAQFNASGYDPAMLTGDIQLPSSFNESLRTKVGGWVVTGRCRQVLQGHARAGRQRQQQHGQCERTLARPWGQRPAPPAQAGIASPANSTPNPNPPPKTPPTRQPQAQQIFKVLISGGLAPVGVEQQRKYVNFYANLIKQARAFCFACTHAQPNACARSAMP
jgi:hypothetical protein